MKNPTLLQRKEGGFYVKEYFTLLAFCTFLFLDTGNLPKAGAQNCPAGSDYFELDGNAITNTTNPPPDDWDLIYKGTSHAEVTTGILTRNSDRLFTEGSKDIADVSTWHWTIQKAPPKDFLLNGGAALYNNDRIYFFGDRYAENGDAEIGFWFFKGGVSPLPNGTFGGHHEVGDILLLSNFVNGGGTSQIEAYEWVGHGGDRGTLQTIPIDGNNLCAIVNSSSTPSPWPYDPKFGSANNFPPGGFYEGGIVLSGLGESINPCFSSFLLETRASQSLTAELKDFMFGNFSTAPQVSVNSARICLGDSATLIATVTGGSGPFTYLWSNGATSDSITVSPTLTTTYTVTVTPTSGCIPGPASGTVTVILTPACSIGNLSPSNLICNNGNYTISSTASASSYSWSMSVDGNPSGWAIIGSSTGRSITFSSGACGTSGFQVHFTLTVTDGSSCVNTCTQAFSPGAPSCNVSIRPPTTLTCSLTSEYLLASYATDIINPTFSWTLNGGSIGAGINDGASLDSILISSPGTYRFTVTDPTNSSNTCYGEVTVTESGTPPGASAYGCTLTCLVTSMQLIASSPTQGVTYSWTGPDGFTSSLQDPVASVAGTYTVTVTDPSNGCTSTATATLSQLTTPPPCSIGDLSPSNLICNNGNYSVSSGLDTTLYSLLWTMNVDGNPAGWSIIGSDSTQTLTFSSGNCGTGGFLVHITLNVTNKINGCVSTCNKTFSPGALSCNVSIRPPVALTCLVTSEYILASYATDIMNPTFAWTMNGSSIGAGINDGASLDSILISSPGTYRFTITDPANSSNTCYGEVTVTETGTPPGASAYGCTLTCLVTSMQLISSSPTQGVTYSWIGPDGFTSTQQDPTASIAGTYTVTVTDPSDGCTSTATATLNQLTTPPPCSIGDLSPSNLICNHGNYSVSSGLDTTLYSLLWTMSVDGNPAGWAMVSSDSAQTLIFSAGDCGTQGFLVHITLTVTGKINGCVSTCSKTFAPGAPACNVSIRPPATLTCLITSEYILASYATDIINPTFSWTLNGSSIGAGINDGASLDSILISSPGTYRFTVTDPANSSNTCFGEVTVTQTDTPPGANAYGCTLTCLVTSMQLIASSPTPGVTYSWIGPSGFTSTQQDPTASIAGTYTVTVTNPSDGCTSTAIATLNQLTTPPPCSIGDLSPSNLICNHGNYTVSSGLDTTLYSLLWTMSVDGNPAGWAIVGSDSAQTLTFSAGDCGTEGFLVHITLTVTGKINGCVSTCNKTFAPGAPACNVSVRPTITLTCVVTSEYILASYATDIINPTFVWTMNGSSIGAGINDGVSLDSILISSPGTYRFTVTDPANSSNTCFGEITVTNDTVPPTVNAGPDEVLNCFITSDILTATASSGTTLLWSPGGQTTASITVSTAGTYVVTATNTGNGCTASDTAVVTKNITPPTVNAGPDQVLNCTVTAVTLTATASSGTTLMWSPGGQTSASITVSTAGTYVVTATNSGNGCSASDTVVVTKNITPPTVNAGRDTVLNCTVTSVTLTATASSGTTLSWSPGGQTTSSITVSTAGTYVVTATNTSNGCTASDTAVVTKNITPPTVNAGPDQVLNCTVTAVTLTATASSGTTLLWSPGGQTTASITVSTPGTYVVTVTNTSNGCTASDTAVVTKNITPPTVNAGPDQVLNCTVTAVTLTATASSGTTLMWSPGGQTTASITVSTPGTYIVTATNTGNGCTASDTAVVTKNITPPTVNAGPDQVLNCTVTAVTLTATASSGTTLMWSPGGQTTASITVSTAGTYIVTATNTSNGCTASDTAVVTKNITPPTVNAGPDQVLNCTVTAVTLTATASSGTTLMWSPGGQTTASITVSTAGTYVVTATNSGNGCSASDTVVVTKNITPPTVNAGPDQILNCNVTSVTLTATASSGTTLSWSPGGQTTSSITVSTAGTYIVTATNTSNGCTASDTAVVTKNITPPTVNAGPDQVLNCTVTAVTLTATASSGTTLLWSPGGQTTASITVSTAGTYVVTATNTSNGCTASDTAVVTKNITPPTVNAGPDQVLNCTVTAVTLTATASSGTTLLWSPGGQTTASITVSTPGTYIVTATNTGNGCTASDTAVVTKNITPPTVNAGPDQVLNCTVTAVTLTATASSGTTLLWSPGGQTTASITVSTAGTYVVTATNSGNGCSASDTVVVTKNITPPTVNAGPDQVLNCMVTAVTLTATASSGTTLLWSPGGQTTASITVSTAGTYVVTATNTGNGCTASDTAVVTKNITPPTVNAGPDQVLNCTVTAVTLTATASSGTTLMWSPGGQTTASITVSTAGTYVVTATNTGNGCTASDTAVVTKNITPPTVNAGPDQVLNCTVTAVTLTATASSGTTLMWSPGGQTTASITVSTAGTYIVTATNTSNGCTASDTAVVTKNITPPTVNAGPDQVLNCTVTAVTLTATASSGTTLLWSPGGQTTASITVSTAGTYVVTATNTGNGCTASDTAVVTKNITPPTVNAGPDQVLNCTVTAVTLTATASSGTTLMWSPGGQTTASITVSTAGTYVVTATNTSNGCTASDTAVVTKNITPPTVNAGPDQVLNCTVTAVTLTATASSGTTLLWSPGGQTTASITVSTAGTYVVTATNTSNGCTASDTAVVTKNITPPTVNAGPDQVLNCTVTAVTLTATASSGTTLMWSPGGQTTASITVSTPGTYVVTATNSGNGCSASDTVVVTKNITPPTVNAGPDQVLNCTVTAVTLTATASSGTALLWSPGGQTTASITVSTPGTYVVTVTNTSNGCTASDTAVVTKNITPPTVNAGTDQVLNCTVTAVTLTATASSGTTLLWSPGGQTTASITVSTPGTYIVTATYTGNGCTASDTAVVTKNIAPPTVNAGPDQVLNCTVTAVTLTATASSGTTLLWSPSGQTTASITVSTAGTYVVTATNTSNGCTASDTAVVTKNITPPGASANGGTLTCVVTSIQLTASSPTQGVTYSWSGPSSYTSSTQNPTVDVAGTYTVTVTNSVNGCTSTATATVNQNITPPGASAVGCVLNCIVTSMQLIASSPTGGVTYSWTGPGGFTSNQQDPSVSVAGTYTVTVTDPDNGCTSTATATIIQNITPPPCSIGNLSPSNLICNHGNYSVSSSLDTTLYSLSWAISVDGNPSGWDIIGSAGGQTLTFSAGDCGTEGFLVHITLTTTDKTNGCVSTCNQTFAPGAPACNVSIRPPVTLTCVITSEYILASYATDIINPIFAWTLNGSYIGSGINDGASLDSILISSPGTYKFTVTDPANPSNTCFGEVVIQNIATPRCNISAPEILPNCGSTGNSLSVTSIGTNPKYRWYVTGSGWVITSSDTVSTITYTAGNGVDSGTFIVVVTDGSNGCSCICTITVNCTSSGGRLADMYVKSYPNPFNSQVTVEFSLRDFAGAATVDIFNVAGAKVATLFSNSVEKGVIYKATFDGSSYPPGIYYCRVTTADSYYYDRLILVK